MRTQSNYWAHPDHTRRQHLPPNQTMQRRNTHLDLPPCYNPTVLPPGYTVTRDTPRNSTITQTQNENDQISAMKFQATSHVSETLSKGLERPKTYVLMFNMLNAHNNLPEIVIPQAVISLSRSIYSENIKHLHPTQTPHTTLPDTSTRPDLPPPLTLLTTKTPPSQTPSSPTQMPPTPSMVIPTITITPPSPTFTPPEITITPPSPNLPQLSLSTTTPLCQIAHKLRRRTSTASTTPLSDPPIPTNTLIFNFSRSSTPTFNSMGDFFTENFTVHQYHSHSAQSNAN